MMIPERPSLERRVLAALDGSTGSGPRIPVVLGGCGSGRTSLLLRLRDLIGRTQAQYVDVERIATTPERFFQALRESSPFPAHAYGQGKGSEPGDPQPGDIGDALPDDPVDDDPREKRADGQNHAGDERDEVAAHPRPEDAAQTQWASFHSSYHAI